MRELPIYVRCVTCLLLVLMLVMRTNAQEHPRIYLAKSNKAEFLQRVEDQPAAAAYMESVGNRLAPYLERHADDPEWIVSRLQMYWKTKYSKVFVKGMDFSHGEGTAPVPTVRFSGSRDWATDYLHPDLADVQPYMDDARGLYLQNKVKPGQPWEWVLPSETGHIIEKINYKILSLAQDAALLYWVTSDEKYANFARDIFVPYMLGMHHREPPQTVEPHRNADLMGLQTFEVIHESVVRPLTLCYDFLYDFFAKSNEDLDMMQAVFKKWADQEIKYGVPDNNWNLMQARYITYLALALEKNANYHDGKGQEYYIDQVLHQNSRKQKSLHDVMKNFDPETGIWPEVAHYSIMVSDDILEVFALIDKTLDNYLLGDYPILEKAILANFNYLFPHGFTTAYGDAKHARLRFRALELLIAQYRKYGEDKKEELVTGLLRRFIVEGVHQRSIPKSLFELCFYVGELIDCPVRSTADVVNNTFYSPNVSWVVQRNGHSLQEGMMISKNASLGNHSHANGINVELYAKGMVVAPDAAAGVSYWSKDHREYYSRFPGHNTVVVDGKSDYGTMNSTHAFEVHSVFPDPDSSSALLGGPTYSNVHFVEPATQAAQERLTGTVRTSYTSGYFVDIFRSARRDGADLKHEYIWHGQGSPIRLLDRDHRPIPSISSDQLASTLGDLVGYDYFADKMESLWSDHFIGHYQMPDRSGNRLNTKLWMKGSPGRTLFTLQAPSSRALHRESVPAELYGKSLPTLVVRQDGEAETRPFVSVIEVLTAESSDSISEVAYFSPAVADPRFVGITVASDLERTDFIYNHQNPDVEVAFTDGIFSGCYGVITMVDDSIRSIFLGSGHEISKNGYGIQILGDGGSVMVLFQGGRLEVQAEVPFILRVPSSGNIQVVDLVIQEGKGLGQHIPADVGEGRNKGSLEFRLPSGAMVLGQ